MMSKSYKQAIHYISKINATEAMRVCILIAQSNPSVFNSACENVGVGASEMDREAKLLVKAGKLIDAIKLVRNMTSMSLKEAKYYVEKL